MSEFNFQPIPKRFMVWDKCEQRFHRLRSEEGSWKYVLDIWEVQCLLERLDQTEVIICQSTNLFDKDGKEIFEGSIVENDKGWKGVVTQYKGQWAVNYIDVTPVGAWQLLYDIKNNVKLVGHILSNPGLMEEK